MGKLYRNDYLIADHLANMNLNETLVQQMVLRDLKYHTNHHRYGYKEELMYRKHKKVLPPTKDETFDVIAQKLHAAALTYDELAKQFYPKTATNQSTIFFQIWSCYEETR